MLVYHPPWGGTSIIAAKGRVAPLLFIVFLLISFPMTITPRLSLWHNDHMAIQVVVLTVRISSHTNGQTNGHINGVNSFSGALRAVRAAGGVRGGGLDLSGLRPAMLGPRAGVERLCPVPGSWTQGISAGLSVRSSRDVLRARNSRDNGDYHEKHWTYQETGKSTRADARRFEPIRLSDVSASRDRCADSPMTILPREDETRRGERDGDEHKHTGSRPPNHWVEPNGRG